MKKILYKTLEIIVVEQNGVITLTMRNLITFMIAAGELFLGCAALIFSQIDIIQNPEFRQFCLWGAYIIIPLSILLFIICAVQMMNNKTVFDFNYGMIIKFNKKYRFQEINSIKLVTVPFADREIYHVSADIKGKEVKLSGGLDRDIMEQIVMLLNSRLARRTQEFSGNKFEIKNNNILINWFFTGIVFLILGVIWSVTGFIFLRDYVYRGLLFWPFGIWLAVFGILEIAGLPLYKWIKSGPVWLRILLLAVWLGSYILICRR